MITIELDKLEFDKDDSDIYCKILKQVEMQLLPQVMDVCNLNQSRASRKLGLSRNTLRQKLFEHFSDKYVGRRD